MQKYLSFFVLLFSFISLFGGWGADLCEEETCSGHGECQDDGEDEWCVCDEGYIASGLDCILGCSGVTCSGHGTCSVVSGAEGHYLQKADNKMSFLEITEIRS